MCPTIHTERLQLREWRIEDVGAAYEMYGDPEVMRFLGSGLPTPTLEEQRNWLAQRIEYYRTQVPAGLGIWAIVERDTDAVVGTMLLKPIPPAFDEIEIGWHLARKAWGKGYATEAGKAVLRYGLEELKLEKIIAVVHPENVRSATVARRLGMTSRGRTNRYYEGEEVDLFTVEQFSKNGVTY
jgi:ribosomal-protein-alanine N-acetyltransferase